MFKTIKLPIQIANEEDKALIIEMQKSQSRMFRTAYKACSDGMHEISIRELLKERFIGSQLDSWFQQSAIVNAKGMFDSDMSRPKKKFRIFGGKKQYIRRCKNLITNEEWRNCRISPLYIVGQANVKGNRKFEFTSTNTISFKPFKGKRIEIELPKLRKNIHHLLRDAFELAHHKRLAITVSMTTEYITFTIDIAKIKHDIKEYLPKASRYAGIDMNPNYIGIAVYDNNKLIGTRLYNMSELTGKNKNETKIQHETREVANDVVKYLKHFRVNTIFLEELNFKQGNNGIGKNFNRLVQNQWKRNDFTSIVEPHFKSYRINAAYTSTIGNVLNRNMPDPVAAATEIALRGYRVVITRSKKFYPDLPSTGYLEEHWKQTEIPAIETWKDLHDWLKNAKLRYRVSVPEIGQFSRNLHSPKSLVHIHDDFVYT